jgi:hypothetical protein
MGMEDQTKPLIRSDGNERFMSYEEMDLAFDALGFYLKVGSGYWYEKLTKMQNQFHQESWVHSDPIEYSYAKITTFESLKKARFKILHEHFGKERVYCLHRRYSYVKSGSDAIKAQRIVCFDIDGRSNTDTKEVVKELVSRFPEIKFIEYNARSRGYHVYIHFDRDVTDKALKRLEEDFKKHGFTIEAVCSREHIRLPMGRHYSLFGFYSPKNKSLIRKATLDELLAYWKGYDKLAYFDPSFEMEEAPRYKKEFRGSYKRNKDRQKNLKQMMLENPSFDYGARERHDKIMSILSFVIRYALSLEDFREIGEAHDKGAREKTDFYGLYEWGKKHFDHKGKEVVYKHDYEVIFDRVERYSTIRLLPPEVDKLLSEKVETDLMPFLEDRRNVNRREKFKNEQLIKQRWRSRIDGLVLFLIQYKEAEREEFRRCWITHTDYKLPMAFAHQYIREGIPLPSSLIKFIGKKHKCGSYPEAKRFLEQIGILKAVELKEGVTYAPGICEYYTVTLPK